MDGVTTSSAVASHELAGILDKVKQVDVSFLGFKHQKQKYFNVVELNLISTERLVELKNASYPCEV